MLLSKCQSLTEPVKKCGHPKFDKVWQIWQVHHCNIHVSRLLLAHGTYKLQPSGISTCTWSSWTWVVKWCWIEITYIHACNCAEYVHHVLRELIRCSCGGDPPCNCRTQICDCKRTISLLAHLFAIIKEANTTPMIIPGDRCGCKNCFYITPNPLPTLYFY